MKKEIKSRRIFIGLSVCVCLIFFFTSYSINWNFSGIEGVVVISSLKKTIHLMPAIILSSVSMTACMFGFFTAYE